TKSAQQSSSLETNLPAVSIEPSDQAISHEVADEVMSAITKLPPQQATAVLLRLIHDQSYTELAQALGCSQVSVRTHVARGREALTCLLAHLAPQRQPEGLV